MMNRETWLNAMAERMAPRFAELGFPLPKFRVSIGFTSGGQRSNAAAEVWSSIASEDGFFEILIRPDQSDSMIVAGHLAHELVHAAVGLKEGHKGNFAKLCLQIGLKPPMTATTPGPAFEIWVQPFIDELGQLPHGRLNWTLAEAPGGKRTPGAGLIAKGLREGLSGDELHELITNAPKKQTTRLLKVACAECGYPARVTRKWLDEVGPPHCPEHGPMDAEEEQCDE